MRIYYPPHSQDCELEYSGAHGSSLSGTCGCITDPPSFPNTIALRLQSECHWGRSRTGPEVAWYARNIQELSPLLGPYTGESKPSMGRLPPSAVGRAPPHTSLHSGQSSSLSHYSGADSRHPILTTISHTDPSHFTHAKSYHIPPQYHPTHIMFILLSWVLVVQNNGINKISIQLGWLSAEQNHFHLCSTTICACLWVWKRGVR